jgi:hypothetical protein
MFSKFKHGLDFIFGDENVFNINKNSIFFYIIDKNSMLNLPTPTSEKHYYKTNLGLGTLTEGERLSTVDLLNTVACLIKK